MWLTMIWNKWSNFLCLFIDVQIFLFAKLDLTEIPSWPDGPLYGCNCELYCSNLHGHGLTATTELHTPTGPIRIRTDRTPPRASMPQCPVPPATAVRRAPSPDAAGGARLTAEQASGPVGSMSPQEARQRALVDCNGGEVRGLRCRPATIIGGGQITMFLFRCRKGSTLWFCYGLL